MEVLDEGPMEEWEKPFLEAYANNYGVIGLAAKEVGVSYKAVARRRRDSQRFDAMMRHAESIVHDTLEYEAVRRALEPNERPIFQRGALVGTVKEWDTRHLEWMLERLMPEKYHIQSRIEIGTNQNEVKFKLALGDSEPTPELEQGDD